MTTPPQIEIDIANGIDRWVFVGTGRLLDDLDLTTPAIADQIQTMYAFRDGTAAAPIAPLAGDAGAAHRHGWQVTDAARASRPSRTRAGTTTCRSVSASSCRSRPRCR